MPKSKNSESPNDGSSSNRFSEILMPEKPDEIKSSSLAAELALLRADYINRIAGMTKAIAAVERSREKIGGAIDLVEQLNGFTSSELIDEYRRVTARFRSAFPTSFGLMPFETGRGQRMKIPEVYK
jgi:hypothetical protein